jgi:adenylate cyclase
VLEASHAFHIAHLSSCGGHARCSTCRVRILAGGEACPPPGRDELATLERINAEPDTRLACQLRPRHDISVVPLMRLDGPVFRQTVAATEVDRDVVILLCEFCNRSALERDHLPHDVLFVFTRYAETACRAVHDAGGTVSYVGHDNICAIFGLHDSPQRACRQALAPLLTLVLKAPREPGRLEHCGRPNGSNGAIENQRRRVNSVHLPRIARTRSKSGCAAARSPWA